jgi:hypothetical protein
MGLSGERHAPATLYPGERTPGTHWTGGWVGPKAGLDAEARRKILCLCRGSNFGRPVHSQDTILTELPWLSHQGVVWPISNMWTIQEKNSIGRWEKTKNWCLFHSRLPEPASTGLIRKFRGSDVIGIFLGLNLEGISYSQILECGLFPTRQDRHRRWDTSTLSAINNFRSKTASTVGAKLTEKSHS